MFSLRAKFSLSVLSLSLIVLPAECITGEAGTSMLSYTKVPSISHTSRSRDPLLTMTPCAPNEKQDKGNLGQKGLSDNTKVDFGATKDHG